MIAAFGAAHAQDGEPVEKRVYFVAGGSHTEGDKERGAEGTSGFNVGIGKRISKHFGIELKGIFKNFDPDASDRADGQPTAIIESKSKALSLDLFYHLGGFSKWDPYFVVGLGRSDHETKVSIDNGATFLEGDIDYLTADIGFGVRNEFTEKGTAIRLDARYRRERASSGSGDFEGAEDGIPDFDDIVINFDFVIPLGAREVDAVSRPNPESNKDGRFYLVPSTQYSRPDGNRGADDNFGFALALGKKYKDNAAFEFRVSRDKLDPQVEGTTYEAWKLLSVGFDILMHREIHPRLQPYIVLGVGYQDGKKDLIGGGEQNLDGITLDYGLGVQSIGYRSPVGWRVDIRNRHVNHDRDRAEGLNQRTSFEDMLVNVGAVIPLGANPYKQRDRELAAKKAADDAAAAAAASAAAEARRKAEAESAKKLAAAEAAMAEEREAAQAAAAVEAEAAQDSDNDNVLDDDDKCPNTPEGIAVDKTGCELDSDNDGVADSKDKCPNSPEGVTVNDEGCEADTDGDSVKDSSDNCPNTPEGAEVDENGCERDNDNDGVSNSADECPNSTVGLNVNAKGCTKGSQVIVLEGVNFKTNSAELTLNAKTILDKVANSLANQPGLKIEIGGHTDWVGPATYNKRLSQKRADAVKAYLGSKGANTGNMTATGFGEASPTADNKTADGRERNRRVEMKTLDSE